MAGDIFKLIRGIKSLILFLFLIAFVCGCSDDEDNDPEELTGRKIVYPLTSGSTYDLEGEIQFLEKNDGSLRVIITMTPTELAVHHPAHLHYGPYATGAEMAAMLMPVDGTTGKSTTELSHLADGSIFRFDDLLKFNGHLKIHGDEGANKDLILAFAQLGISSN